MKALVCLLLAVAVTDARRFTACEWARTLKANGMAGYRGVSLADWVCVTYHESRYNTAAVNHNSDGSKDYGIFQLNSHYWCSDGGESVANGCGITCDQLLTDDVSVAIRCAKTVVRDPNGLGVMWGSSNSCKDQDNSGYIADCRL
uniref:lysozyme n=1 Tax=Sphaeramia orbicularis TaxID=375764 RepID=A0A672ZXY3_9TELE